MNRIFLDTNIVLDFLGERAGFYDAAAKVISLADKKEITVLVSPVSLSTAYYILCKYENSKVALEKCRKFKLLCNIATMDDDVVEKALISSFVDFEDALQHHSALASRADFLLTRNLKDFKDAMLPVMDAESYLQMWKRKDL